MAQQDGPCNPNTPGNPQVNPFLSDFDSAVQKHTPKYLMNLSSDSWNILISGITITFPVLF